MQNLPFYTDTKSAIEEYIQHVIERRIEDAGAIHSSYKLLWERIGSVSQSGGKRLRPYLTMVGCGSFDTSIVPVAAAQELLHIAMLMHDDIIDQDLVRHGRQNLGGLYDEQYRTWLEPVQARHYAYGSAIVGGDVVLSEAYNLVAQSGLPAHIIVKLLARLHQSIFEVVGGELLDVEAAFVRSEIYDPMTIYRYKTAGYSFTGPLLAGAICAESDEATQLQLATYGLNAGIAFQLQDDLLGLFGDEAVTGKSTLTDLREAKATYLIAVHKSRMNREMEARFNQYFGTTENDDALAQLKQDIIDSGAKTEAEDAIESYYGKASAALDTLPQRDILRALTNTILQRDV